MSKYKENIEIAFNKGYKVDLNGNVIYKEKLRKCQIKKDKSNCCYYVFNIRNKKSLITIKVHQLQAYQKYGEKIFKDDIVVRHLNGNSLDNSYNNILIGTQSDNIMDIPEEKRKATAIHAASFITKYNHKEIYDFYIQTKSYKQTMQKFNIPSKNTINMIKNKFNKC